MTPTRPATGTKRIEPVTLTVTLTGRKAAAFRRMIRYDGLTAQEAADESMNGHLAAFTEMEVERKRKAAGTARPKPAFCPEFVERLADGIADKLVTELVDLDIPNLASPRLKALMDAEMEERGITLAELLSEILSTRFGPDAKVHEAEWGQSAAETQTEEAAQ